MKAKTKKLMMAAVALTCLTACQESLEQRCAREAKEFTEKKCPAHINDNMTVDSLLFFPATHTLQYCYTLEGVLDNSETLGQHDLRGLLLKELRNSTQVKLYKEAGYNFKYTYYSQKDKGRVLFETVIKEKDYQ